MNLRLYFLDDNEFSYKNKYIFREKIKVDKNFFDYSDNFLALSKKFRLDGQLALDWATPTIIDLFFGNESVGYIEIED